MKQDREVVEYVMQLKDAYEAVKQYEHWDCNQEPLEEYNVYIESNAFEEHKGETLTLKQFQMAKEYSDYWDFEPDYDYDLEYYEDSMWYA